MFFFILSALIILIDRGVKLWIIKTLEVGQALPFIPGILQITHVENTGAAFSIFSNMRWPLVIVSSVAVIVLIFVILLYRDGEIGRLSASFMLGGAVGNLIDRAMTGRVTDMFEVEFMNFAVFNVADIFVTVGCLMFIIHLVHLMIKTQREKRSQEALEPAEQVEALPVRKPAPQAPAAPVNNVTPITRAAPVAPVTSVAPPVAPVPPVVPYAAPVMPSDAVPSPYDTGAPMIEQELTEEQILMEYYMELGIDKSDF